LKAIEQINNFISEPKSKIHKTRLVGLSYYENSAEHSWKDNYVRSEIVF